MRNALRMLVSVLALGMATPAFAVDGKAVYEKTCASCHGADGKGNAAKAKVLKLDPEKLNLGRDEVKDQTKAEKKDITAKGKAKMPGYASKISPEELDAVTEHVMQLIAAIRK